MIIIVMLIIIIDDKQIDKQIITPKSTLVRCLSHKCCGKLRSKWTCL